MLMAILEVTLYTSQSFFFVFPSLLAGDWVCTWIAFRTSCVRATMENTIRYKPEVETVPRTGSTHNLATETDIDAIPMAIPMFSGASFSLVYMPTSPNASSC